jgi:hypothetical protein
MQIELDLQTSQGNLGRRVTGLHVERPLETAMEVACKILVKLVEVSDRFDSLSNSGKRPTVANPRGVGPRECKLPASVQVIRTSMHLLCSSDAHNRTSPRLSL